MQVQVNRQGGWIASFVIIGVLLVVSLVGGVYYLKTSQQSNKQTKTETVSQSAVTDKQKSNTDSDNKDNQSADKNDVSTPEKSEPAAGSADKDENRPADTRQEVDEELPQTGPSETVASLVAASLLAFASVAYVRSRRNA